MVIKYTIDGVDFSTEETIDTIPILKDFRNIIKLFEDFIHNNVVISKPHMGNIDFDINIDSIDFNK